MSNISIASLYSLCVYGPRTCSGILSKSTSQQSEVNDDDDDCPNTKVCVCICTDYFFFFPADFVPRRSSLGNPCFLFEIFFPNDFNFINATSSIDGMILRAEVCFPIFFYSFSRKAPRKSLDLLWRFFLVLPLVTRRLFSREMLESKTQLI